VFRGILYHGSTNQIENLDEESLFSCILKSDETSSSPLSKLGKSNSFLWIDISSPTAVELASLAQRFNLDPQIVEDLRAKEGRPKLHDYDNYIYLIFHAISLESDEHHRLEIGMMEIDCLIGPDWLLTIHSRPLRAFDDIATRWARKPEWMQKGPGYLLYELMDSVLDAYFPILEQLDNRIDAFEDKLYRSSVRNEQGVSLSSEIFALKRVLLEIRHIAGPTRDVVNILLRRDAEEGGKHFAAFQDLFDHSSRIVENIDTYRDILSGALDAYLAIESNRMNAVMKNFTAYSIVLLVPSLIAGIYGMNFDDLPKAHGFWNAITLMGIIVVSLIIFFKRRQWL
jgi:magnesium transporter